MGNAAQNSAQVFFFDGLMIQDRWIIRLKAQIMPSKIECGLHDFELGVLEY